MSEIIVCDGPDCDSRRSEWPDAYASLPWFTVTVPATPDKHYCSKRCIVRGQGGTWPDDQRSMMVPPKAGA